MASQLDIFGGAGAARRMGLASPKAFGTSLS
jgi:hypothetical protein